MSTPRDKIEAKLGLSGPPLQSMRDSPPAIPDHELVRRIGQGAYGEVWLACNALGTWRAVKIVYRDNFKDERPYEREFAGIRRFEPLSRSNEGFVDVLQVGRFDSPRGDEFRESPIAEPEDCGGWFYYVMELADATAVPGAKCQVSGNDTRREEAVEVSPDTSHLKPETYVPRTLARDLHHRDRLPLEDCLQLGLSLTLALGHLHRHGLIHRDIKPSNIIFVGGVPKLADIGLVTEAQGANTFVGTEGFVPPEGPTSPQADLYALGKVLYEAAMGKDRHEFPEPFTQIGIDHESVALMELNAVLLRACAPDPKKRYATAEEMHADLALLHSGGSVKRRHQFDRQFLIAKQVVAVAIAATLLIGTAWLWQRQQTQKMTRLAAEKTALATEKSELAGNLTKLDAENRNRIVRLDIANGIRLLDEGDPAGALLWFADALPLLTNHPVEESIHRIRIQQTLNQMPRPVQMFAHDAAVRVTAFSPDGNRFVAGTDKGWLHVWDVQTGLPASKPFQVHGDELQDLSFTSDGERLLVTVGLRDRTATPDGNPARRLAIIEVASGQTVFSTVVADPLPAEFVADGRWLVTAGVDHVIRVTDVRDGHHIATLMGHTNNILGILASIQGDVLATFSEDRTTRVWRLPSGELVGNPLPYNPDYPLRPALSEDGQRLATHREGALPNVTETNCVQIWRTDTMAYIGGLTGRLDQIGTVRFVGSGKNRRLLNGFGGRLHVLDPDTQAEIVQLRVDSLAARVTGVRNGNILAVVGRNGLDGIWSLATGKLVVPPLYTAGYTGGVLMLSDDGSHLATADEAGTCLLWRLEPRREDATLRLPSNPQDLHPRLFGSFSPERSHLLLPLKDGSVHLIDLEQLSSRQLPGTASQKMEPGSTSFGHSHRQWVIYYYPKASAEDAILELWRDDGGVLHRLPVLLPQSFTNNSVTEGRGFTSIWREEDGTAYKGLASPFRRMLRFAPGDESVTAVTVDGQIQTWRTMDGTLENATRAPETLECHALFPDGRTILAWDRSGGLVLYDRVTGALQPTLPGQNAVTALAFDATGGRFATTTEDGWARAWSAKDGMPLGPRVQQGGVLTWADWSPDGSRIATAGFTPEVRVWNAASGESALSPLRLGNEPLQTVMWSLDGRFLVARSDENVVRVWDAATGEAVTPMLKHETHVRLAHLVANNRLITLSLPNLLRAWDLTENHLPADVILDYAKVVAGRRLSRNSMLQPLKPAELATLYRPARARAPELFQ